MWMWLIVQHPGVLHAARGDEADLHKLGRQQHAIKLSNLRQLVGALLKKKKKKKKKGNWKLAKTNICPPKKQIIIIIKKK